MNLSRLLMSVSLLGLLSALPVAAQGLAAPADREVVAPVGPQIALQGNRALVEIRYELQEKLRRQELPPLSQYALAPRPSQLAQADLAPAQSMP